MMNQSVHNQSYMVKQKPIKKHKKLSSLSPYKDASAKKPVNKILQASNPNRSSLSVKSQNSNLTPNASNISTVNTQSVQNTQQRKMERKALLEADKKKKLEAEKIFNEI